MKKIITEDVEKNTAILRDLSRIVYDWIQSHSQHGEQIIRMENISGFDALEKKYTINKLFTNNSEKLKELIIQIYYDRDLGEDDMHYARMTSGKNLLFGYYYNPQNRIALFYHDIKKYSRNSLYMVDSNKLQKTLRYTISHELRHFFQYREYPNYFAKLRGTVYNERPTEIDAVFYEILTNTDPFGYIKQPEKYVDYVVDLLQQSRTLNDKQKKQYRIQTAKYYTKHIDANLLDMWKRALTNNARFLDLKYPQETFVGNVLDELEKYVATAHFREMHDPVYLHYRKLTRQYYAEKTRDAREKQQSSKLYSQVYPIMIATAKQLIPVIRNSRISTAEAVETIMKNTRQAAETRGIKTDTPAYVSLEKQLKQKLQASLGP